MTPITNKFYITISADPNDADYIENQTVIDIDEYTTADIVLNFFNVMKKLEPNRADGWHHIDFYFNKLSEDDISHLMRFESAEYEEDSKEYYKQFEIKKFSLLDSECKHESRIVDMFPYFEGCRDFDDGNDRIKGFHTLNKISAIYINGDGKAFEL